MPLIRKWRIVAEDRFVEQHVIANGGRRGVPLFGKWSVVGILRRRQSRLPAIPCPYDDGGDHAGGHQNIEGQQREHVAEEFDLEQLQEDEPGDGPRQQQEISALGYAATPCQPRGERDRQPRGYPQRQTQSPHRGLADLIPESRGIHVLAGERHHKGIAYHTRLLLDVADHLRVIQERVGGCDEVGRQCGKSG